MLISQGYISVFYNISQPNFAILLILRYNDIFRLSCLDKKLVDNWNHLLAKVVSALFIRLNWERGGDETGMDLLGGGVRIPPSPGQGGVLFFMIKPKIIRDKMRFSNLSNNMMISEL